MRRLLPYFCCGLALLAGCAGGPAPLAPESAARAQAQAEMLARLRRQAPAEALDAAGAGALALRGNLELRLAALQRLLADAAVDAADLHKLPQLMLQAGYSRRSHLEPGDGAPLERRLAGQELTWDVLSFATAWLRAGAASDQTLLAALNVRDETNRVLLETRLAWQAVSHQAGREALLDAADARIGEAVALLARLQHTTLMDPQLLALKESELWQMQSRLRAARLEARAARWRLASLLAVADGEALRVAAEAQPEREAQLALLERLRALAPERLERQALLRRSDLAKTDVQARLLRHEAALQWVAALPGLSLNRSRLRDTDSAREPAWWTERGADVSVNLFSWLALFQQRQELGLRRSQLQQRQLLLAVGIVEQVRVARERLDSQLAQWQDARTRLRLAQARSDLWNTRTPFHPDDEFSRASAVAALADARIQADQAWEAALRAGWQLMGAVGLDFAPPQEDAPGSTSDNGVAEAVRTAQLRAWWAALPAQVDALPQEGS